MLGDVFISAELKGYICYLLHPYTLDKEVSQRLREEGGNSGGNCHITRPSFLDVGPGTCISQLQLHHCFPTIPFWSRQRSSLATSSFNLGFSGRRVTHFLSIQARNLEVSLPFLTRPSCQVSLICHMSTLLSPLCKFRPWLSLDWT